MIHLPRNTGAVRVGTEVMVNTLAMVMTPPRPESGGSETRRNSFPVTPAIP